MKNGKTIVFGTLLLVCGTLCAEPSKPNETSADVVIYGGSSAGIAAAVAAHRCSLSCVVIEPSQRIGGLTTGGLGQTDIGNKRAFGGIAREFYEAVKSYYDDDRNWKFQRREDYRATGQARPTPGEEKTMWTFEPSAALKILRGWVARDGIRVEYGERLDRSAIPGAAKGRTKGVVMDGGRIVAIRMESGRTFRGKMFIDATYEGDLMAAAGVSYTVGRESNSVYGETLNGCQPSIPSAEHHQVKKGVSAYVVPGDKSSGLLPGIDTEAMGAPGTGDHRVQGYCFRSCLTDDPRNRIAFKKPSGYDERDYELLLRNLEAGEDWHVMGNCPLPNRKTDTNNDKGTSLDFIGANWDYPEASYAEREKIVAAHLKYQQGLFWTLANHPRVPKAVRDFASRWGTCKDEFEDGFGDGWQRQLYVREARRMVGDYVMTEHNCVRERMAGRPVAYAAYTMDSHHVRRYVTADGCVRNEGNVEESVKRGPYPIDYGAIIPKRGDCINLFVPVCLSASHIAYGSIRMEPVFFSLGEVSARAAAEAIRYNIAVQDVDWRRAAVDVPGMAPRPVALMGFATDVKALETDVMKSSRYVYETYIGKWVDPADYGRFSVLYFGEKIDGEAKGRNFKRGESEEARAALTRFLDAGGVAIVGGEWCMRQLFGWPDKKNPDRLRGRVVNIPKCIGRMKAAYAKEGKSLGYADDAGNFIVTPEGQEVQRLVDVYAKAFAQVQNIKKAALEGVWDPTPLGEPGYLRHAVRFAKRAQLGKAVERRGALPLLKDGKKAVIVVPPELEKDCRKLADEIAWHLSEMSGEKFDIVSEEPSSGPALVYRTVRPGKNRASARNAYMKIWREGEKVYLGGEDTGKSRATTYILEALGCRYLWPGKSGKVIPRRREIVLPEIDLEAGTSFAVRRIRTYGRPEWRDRPENRDFHRWHGMNDNSFMTSDKPNDADAYEWGHFFKDFYPKYYKDHREWFALQPDGSRTLKLGRHVERPTFCLSNPGLAEKTAERVLEKIRRNPWRKAVSLCLPDGATASWCMCESCRKLDPVNAAPSTIGVYFPERKRLPYVALTDRVYFFMNRVAEKVASRYPEMLLSCYAYGGYTAPPVKVKPHKNLLVLSVAGYYNQYVGSEVEENLAAWTGFGNKVLWRPNAHGGFFIQVPQNLGRRMFDDISLMEANGIIGVDYDTMASDWALKPLMYYAVCRAHFNPDRLDYDTVADDFCRAGFGAAAKPVKAYFDHLEKACAVAARQNKESPMPATWQQKTEAACRVALATDYDHLLKCTDEGRKLAANDSAVCFRIGRLAFAAELGRKVLKWRMGRMTAEEKADAKLFVKNYLAKDPAALPADTARSSSVHYFK